MQKNVKAITVFLLLGCTLVLSSILGREFCKYQENPNKELDFFNEVNPFLEVSAPPMIQSLVFGTAGNIPDLDPHAAYDSASIDVFDQVIERLYDFNLTDPYYNIYPRLATDFPVITDGPAGPGTNWTISLRPGVMFHDNTLLTATTAKWSFDRLMYFCNESNPTHLPSPFNKSLPVGIAISPIKTLYTLPDGRLTINRTEIVDPLTIRLILNAPKVSLLSVLCYVGSGMLSPSSTTWTTTYNTVDYIDYIPISWNLVGTGPFEYEYFVHDVEVKFKRNEQYWQTPAKLEELVYVIIDNTNTRNQALLAGVVDLLDAPDIGFYPQFAADPNIDLIQAGSSVGINFMGMNFDYLPDANMRKAISYSVNYTYMTDEIMLGRADRLKSPIPIGIPMANDTLNYATYNLTYARQIIMDNDLWGAATTYPALPINDNPNDAAWLAVADGVAPLAVLNTSYNTETERRRLMAQFVASESLRSIGIECTDFGYDWSTYMDILNEQHGRSNDEWVIYVLGWGPDYIDPENYITPLYTATAGPNGMNLDDPILEAMMAAGECETDLVLRKAIYDAIQKYILEELYPMLYCFTAHNYDALQTYVHGWVPNPIGIKWFYPVYIGLDDLTPPDITIQSPVSDQVFGLDAPTFTITIIDESPVDSTWYTIDGGLTNYTFSGLIGTVNQTAWNDAGIGSIGLTFYANDTLGNLGSETVNIFKDTVAPDITIQSPVSDQVFGLDAPTFTITIIDESPVDSTWYTIDGGLTNYTFSGLIGTVNQTAWDSASQGNILITFSAEDGTGKIGTSSVTVIKSIPSELPIPGYDVFLIFVVISSVAIILMKKIKSK